jgi:hypothetical protein
MARDLRDPLRPKEFALGLNDEIVILSLASDKCCCLQVDTARHSHNIFLSVVGFQRNRSEAPDSRFTDVH